MERYDTFRHLQSGFHLSPDEAAAAEVRVGTDPNAVAERLSLVGYYWSKSCADDRFAEAWSRHVIDLIQRDPSADFLRMGFFTRPTGDCRETLLIIRDEWLTQMELHPSSVEIIHNAAAFFAELDPMIADRLMMRACEVDGDRGGWAFRRALLLS